MIKIDKEVLAIPEKSPGTRVVGDVVGYRVFEAAQVGYFAVSHDGVRLIMLMDSETDAVAMSQTEKNAPEVNAVPVPPLPTLH